MRQIVYFLFLLVSCSAHAQVGEDSDLFKSLKVQDSILFELGFNQCDLEFLKTHVSDDLKFFHDQSGFQDKNGFLENTQKYICSNSDKKPIRKRDKNSLEVFPLYNDGELYGAIQKGIHDFYIRVKGHEDIRTGTAKFTHVWVLENEIWKISEVLSYDHQ